MTEELSPKLESTPPGHPEEALLPADLAPESGEPAAAGPWRMNAFAACLLLMVIVVIVFGRTLGFEFVNYGNVAISENPAISSGLTLDGLSWSFTHLQSGGWHPLAGISHMLDSHLYGAWAGGHHLTNVLLHAAGSMLFFLLLRKLTGSFWSSLFAATIWAIHPWSVESVAWIERRGDLLADIFFVLAAGAYVNYTHEPSAARVPERYAVMVMYFVLGLLSGNSLLALPFVLLFLDFRPLRQFGKVSWQYLILEKLPLFAAAAAAAVAAAYDPAPGRFFPIWEVGVAVGLVCGIRVVTSLGQTTPQRPLHTIIFGAAGAGLVAVALFLALPAIAFWHDSETLWAHRLEYSPNDSLAHDNLGAAFLDWGDTNAAIGHFEKAIAIQPAFPEAHNHLGEALFRQGKTDEAISHYKIALKNRPDFADATANLGAALLKKGETDAAIAAAREALRMQPDFPGALETLGQAAIAKGKFRDAIAQFEKSLKLRPNDAGVYNQLGIAWRQQGDIDQAIVEFRKAVEIDPSFAIAYGNLASALMQKGSLEDAFTNFRKALITDPKFAEASCNLGNALLQAGDVDGAIAQYNKTLEIQPDYADAFNNLGVVFSQRGRNVEALSFFKKTLEANPAHADANYNLGNILLQSGQLEDALVHLQKAYDARPGHLETEFNLANVLFRLGRAADAIPHYRNIIATVPDNAPVLGNLGNALLEQGQWSEAIDCGQRALDLQPDNVAFQNNLAWMLATCPDAALRDPKKALKLAQAASSSDSGNPSMIHTLAVSYGANGQTEEAIKSAKKALELAEAQNDEALAVTIRKTLQTLQNAPAQPEIPKFRDTSEP